MLSSSALKLIAFAKYSTLSLGVMLSSSALKHFSNSDVFPISLGVMLSSLFYCTYIST